MKNKDTLFEQNIKKNFEFDDDVAVVFDDMVSRSVPFYQETLKLCSSLAINNSKVNSYIYDLGCSTASLLIDIKSKAKHNLNLVGVDNSPSMIKTAKEKLHSYGFNISLINKDLFDIDMNNIDVAIANYTMQFIRPLKRIDMIKKIYNGLNNDGVFICSEKLVCEDKALDIQLINEYLEFKKSRGYSNTQIMQKRKALENVLIPYTMQENIEMFKKAGFKHTDIVFRWGNFATFFSRK